MERIAVYGKGGIGKSTISANLSVALAHAGRRVLQVGCDPKHDSTRLLLGGARLTTVLDYLRETKPTDRTLDEILVEGFAGVGCVEAGGPKPGVGCAGRGIISTFDLLEQFQLDRRYDTVVYDVLGDVVCGGFAVPIRNEYANVILVVTSGEFMSLYAANNILRGIRNYDGADLRRVAGLVYNRRNVEGEDERVERFAKAVGLPLFAEIPRSDSFAQAEHANETVLQQARDTQLCDLFNQMAARLVANPPLYEACPLSDEQLEEAVLGSEMRASESHAGAEDASSGEGEEASESFAESPALESGSLQNFWESPDLTDPNRYLSKTLVSGGALHGCAFSGALSAAVCVDDAVIVAHAPTSCANISFASITSMGRRRLYERGTLLPVSLSPNLVCTNMGESEIVFGGTDKLLQTVRRVKDGGARAIIVVSSCPAGIIGDDLDVVRTLSDERCRVLPLKTDGNMTGDYMQGQIAAHLSIARTFFKRDVELRPRTVNVFGEKTAVSNTQSNFELISGFLERMGVTVNCRFLNETTIDQLETFCSAELNLPAFGDYSSQLMGQLIRDEFGGQVFERAFPVGFDETADWLREIGAYFGREQVAEEIIAQKEQEYRKALDQLRPALEGKRLMVLTYNCELDWILKTALDLGMDIVRIGVMSYSQDKGFRTRLDVDLPVIEDYDRSARADEIKKLAPDVLLSNYSTPLGDDVPAADIIPMCPDIGFQSSIKLARRWARLLAIRLKGGWRNDGNLFEEQFL